MSTKKADHVRHVCFEPTRDGVVKEQFRAAGARLEFRAAGAQLERAERVIKMVLIQQIRLTAGGFRAILENLAAVRDDPTVADAWIAAIDAKRKTFEIAFAAIPCRTGGCLCQALVDQACDATVRIEDMFRIELTRAAHGIAPSADSRELEAAIITDLVQLENNLAGMECALTGGWRWR